MTLSSRSSLSSADIGMKGGEMRGLEDTTAVETLAYSRLTAANLGDRNLARISPRILVTERKVFLCRQSR